MLLRKGNTYYDSDACRKIYEISSESKDLADPRERHARTEVGWWKETLYQRPRGELWILGQGNGGSKYHGSTGGFTCAGMQVIGHRSTDDVRAWLIDRLGELKAADVLTAMQDDLERTQDKTKGVSTTMCLYMPVDVQQMARRIAKARDISVSRLISNLIRAEEHQTGGGFEAEAFDDDLDDFGLN